MGDREEPGRGRPCCAPLAITDFRPSAAEVPRFSKFELSFDINRSFGNPFDPDRVVDDAEFTGPDGVFGDATLTTGRRGAITEYELDLEIRLETSVEDLIDPAVAGLLDGELFGTPVAELERRAGRPLDQTVSLVVRADIPGGGGRFPDIGTAGLAEGGVFSLVVAGDVMDPEIDAADAAAADARDEVSRGVRIMWLVWVIVGVAAIALLVALRATRRITR